MFYDPREKRSHGLPHDPFNALVVPRPIGWISTLNEQGGVNLAPYSFFNAVGGRPPFVYFASNTRKHSQVNAERTGEFVVNVATYHLREQMNVSSAHVPAYVEEPELAGLEMVPSRIVKPPRVKLSPVAMECYLSKTVEYAGRSGKVHPSVIIIGEVVGIHIDDSVIVDGHVDPMKLQPLSRLGYMDYGVLGSTFTMLRPDDESNG